MPSIPDALATPAEADGQETSGDGDVAGSGHGDVAGSGHGDVAGSGHGDVAGSGHGDLAGSGATTDGGTGGDRLPDRTVSDVTTRRQHKF